jgi:glycosyltransferase involved in cell wall biosynthesis
MLALCLERLSPGAQTLDASKYEVIVSDDGVPTVEQLIAEKYPWANWIAGPQRGPAANRNHGASVAKGDWIVFTDDDCMPQIGWLEAYAKNMNGYAVLEGKTSAHGVRTRIDEECPINETGGYLWSCNFAMQRNQFLSLDGFNEIFQTAGMEDVEFNTRVEKASLNRQFVPSAQVLHPWRRRGGHSSIRKYAQSVGYYVSLHPEMASKFTLSHQANSVLRSIVHSASYAFRTGMYPGICRQILLGIYAGCLIWFEVVQSNKRLPRRT